MSREQENQKNQELNKEVFTGVPGLEKPTWQLSVKISGEQLMMPIKETSPNATFLQKQNKLTEQEEQERSEEFRGDNFSEESAKGLNKIIKDSGEQVKEWNENRLVSFLHENKNNIKVLDEKGSVLYELTQRVTPVKEYLQAKGIPYEDNADYFLTNITDINKFKQMQEVGAFGAEGADVNKIQTKWIQNEELTGVRFKIKNNNGEEENFFFLFIDMVEDEEEEEDKENSEEPLDKPATIGELQRKREEKNDDNKQFEEAALALSPSTIFVLKS